MWITTERILTKLKHVAHFASSCGISYPSLLYLVGRAAENGGAVATAARFYQRAIAAADRSSNRAMFKVRQHWQFCLERLLHSAGMPRVNDPLFSCDAFSDAATRVTISQRRQAPGHYEASWRFRGLRIDGFLDSTRGGDRRIRVLLDGVPIRDVTAAKMPFAPPYFQLTLQRPTIACFPVNASLSVEAGDGKPLLANGCCAIQVHVPHGNTTFQEIGNAVDKKGFISSSGSVLQERQSGFLKIYDKAREAFEREFDKPLLLLYGTLLGFHRERDIIPGDDDFDVGYVSSRTSPEAVKREAMQIVVRLVLAGFIVSFNRNGRLFRLRLPSFPPDTHLDVHSIWFERSKAWIHPQASLDCEMIDFLPARRDMMRGTMVYVPLKPEAFLQTYYGPGWQVPDPSYSTAAKHVPDSVRRRLARALVTPADLSRMQRNIASLAGSEGARGRLISIGSYGLYPLNDYEQNCDW